MFISPIVEEVLKDGHIIHTDESSWDDKYKVLKGVKRWLN